MAKHQSDMAIAETNPGKIHVEPERDHHAGNHDRAEQEQRQRTLAGEPAA